MIAKKLFTLAVATMALPLALSACGRDDDADQNLSSLDDSLGNVSDPALRGALEDQIIVDPELASRSNANAVRPADRPGTGTLPPEIVATQYDAPIGGKLFRAPKAVEAAPCSGCEAGKPVTLGAMARQQDQREQRERADDQLVRARRGADLRPPEALEDVPLDHLSSLRRLRPHGD